MRFAFALLLAACSTQLDGIPVGGGIGSGGGDDGGSLSDAAGAQDLASAPAAPDLGAVGAMCTSACDCQPGLACRRGKCAMSMLGMVYCCGSATCPQGSLCQSAQGGQLQMCGG